MPAFAGMTTSAKIVMFLLFIACLPACTYTARGKVIEGHVSSVEVIHNDDPRARMPGIANVDSSIELDVPKGEQLPLDRQGIAGRQFTNSSGFFKIPLHQTNADWSHHKWRVHARKRGYQSVSGVIQMPPNHTKWTILVTLAPGNSAETNADAARESE